MYTLDDLIICIPTFKRKWPAILSLIRYTDDLTFYLCVREDDYNAGYYDEVQFKLPNIKYMLIKDVECIGETREQIIQQSIQMGYKFCLMMDDTQYGIHDTTNRITTLKTILQNCLNRFETDVYRKKAFAFNFARKAFSTTPKKQQTYFITQLCQTYILNLDVVKKYDLHFKKMSVVGVEDLTFYYEACKKKLVCLSDTRFIRIGQMPSTKKEGGCHYGNENRKERDVQNERFDILLRYFREHNYEGPLLKKVDSVLNPGTVYYKLNTKYAKETNAGMQKVVFKIN